MRERSSCARARVATQDGRQEVHFSTQEPGKRPGAHAESVDVGAFARFVDEVGDLPLDCILEVKDKERSVLRVQELVTADVSESDCSVSHRSTGLRSMSITRGK